MKAIIPTAGQGTRLYPHTHTKPKPMVRIAGRPIIGHILAGFEPTRIEEVVVVVGGPMQNQVVDYVERTFGDAFAFSFVEQPRAEGLGHSIYQARPVAEGDDVFVALGDMLFENSYGTFLDAYDECGDVDGALGVKSVDEPQHYGVVEVDDAGRVTSLVEKPDDPPSNLAISGVYVVEDSGALFEALEYLIENDLRGAGDEYQLTDALARMVDRGATLGTFEVEDWYDCGRPETLLEANRVTLDRVGNHPDFEGENSVVVPPVDIGEGVTVEQSIVGPHVTVDDGATVEHSLVRDSIVGRDSHLEDVNIEASIVGDNTRVVGDMNRLDIGDNSSIEL